MNIRHPLTRLLAAASIAASVTTAGSALAAGPQIHLRGEITSVSASQIVVKARNGSTTTVQLPEKLQVLDVSATTLSAVAENSYIGVAAAPAGAGKIRALGLMVFPEGARGLNEGHFPWDLQDKSTMTNATVSKLLHKGDGAQIEVRWGDKTQSVLVDQKTVISQFVPGARTLLVNGARVFVFASQAEGGPPSASAIMVGRDGFLPTL